MHVTLLARSVILGFMLVILQDRVYGALFFLRLLFGLDRVTRTL